LCASRSRRDVGHTIIELRHIPQGEDPVQEVEVVLNWLRRVSVLQLLPQVGGDQVGIDPVDPPPTEVLLEVAG
jgi:hypothetical protein